MQNNSEVNNSKTRVQQQQNTSESNVTTVKETEGYDNSVRKDIINLKNDVQEIKEALKSLLTKQ